MTTKVSLVGAAGTLSSCAAFAITMQGLADELVRMNVNENLFNHDVIDLETSVIGLQNIEVCEDKDEDLAGSDIVIIGTGVPWRIVKYRDELTNKKAYLL